VILGLFACNNGTVSHQAALQNVQSSESVAFKSFYPSGCVVNNQAAGISGTCECIEDPVTGDVWVANMGPSIVDYQGADTYVGSLKKSKKCGLEDWIIPTSVQVKRLSAMSKYSYKDPNKTNGWLNNNGFVNLGTGVNNGASYYWINAEGSCSESQATLFNNYYMSSIGCVDKSYNPTGSGSSKNGSWAVSPFPQFLSSFSINGVVGKRNGQGILVVMPNGTNLVNLIATFTTVGSSVTVGSTAQVSGTTPNDFRAPVQYVVLEADGNTNTYTVTVTVPDPLFSCVKDYVTGNKCGCVFEKDGSGLVWYADASQSGTWNDWCSKGIFCNGSDGSSMVAFNNANHCGYRDWHLPSVRNPGRYVDKVVGDWGTLGTYAKNNGWIEGTAFYTWLNNNYFINVTNSVYLSDDTSEDILLAPFAVSFSGGELTFVTMNYKAGIMLVRGGQ
jgi:hypothetical protein